MLWVSLGLMLGLSLGCRQAEPTYPTQRVDNPYHVGDVRMVGLEHAEQQDAMVLEQAIVQRSEIKAIDRPPAGSQWRLVTMSEDERFVAYVVNEAKPRILVHNQQTDQTIEITSLPHPTKAFIGLNWQQEHVLVFERWHEPARGMQYQYEAESQRLIMARPVLDATMIPANAAGPGSP